MSFDKGDVVDAQGHPSAAEQWLPAVIVDKGGAASATLYFACDGPRHEHDIARHKIRAAATRRNRTAKRVAEAPGSSGSPQFARTAAKVAKQPAAKPFGQPMPDLPPPKPANPANPSLPPNTAEEEDEEEELELEEDKEEEEEEEEETAVAAEGEAEEEEEEDAWVEQQQEEAREAANMPPPDMPPPDQHAIIAADAAAVAASLPVSEAPPSPEAAAARCTGRARGRGRGRRGGRRPPAQFPVDVRPPNVLSLPHQVAGHAAGGKPGNRGNKRGRRSANGVAVDNWYVGDDPCADPQQVLRRKLPLAMKKMAIIGEQANLDIFILARDKRTHRFVGEQNNRGPWPRYYVYNAGVDIAEEGDQMGGNTAAERRKSGGLEKFQKELNSAKSAYIRNDEKGAYCYGHVYARTFNKDIGRPPKNSAAERKRREPRPPQPVTVRQSERGGLPAPEPDALAMVPATGSDTETGGGGATETPSMAEAAAAAGVLDDEPAVGTSAAAEAAEAAAAAAAAAAMPPPPPTMTRAQKRMEAELEDATESLDHLPFE